MSEIALAKKFYSNEYSMTNTVSTPYDVTHMNKTHLDQSRALWSILVDFSSFDDATSSIKLGRDININLEVKTK